MDLPRFVHLLVDGRVGSFHLLAIMNNAAMKTCVQFFVWTVVFISLCLIPRCGIDGSDGKSMFNFFEEPPDVF